MDEIQEETELSQPSLDNKLWKELLSAAKLSRLTTAPKMVVIFSLSHRFLLQITHTPSLTPISNGSGLLSPQGSCPPADGRRESSSEISFPSYLQSFSSFTASSAAKEQNQIRNDDMD